MMPKKPIKILRQNLETLQSDVQALRDSYSEHKLRGFVELDEFKFVRKKNILGLRIKECFVRFMAHILKDYRKYLIPITQHSSTKAQSELFFTEKFLNDIDKSTRTFYQLVLGTQMWDSFLHDRQLSGSRRANIKFFDRCIDLISTQSQLESHPLITIDRSFQSEHTKLIGFHDVSPTSSPNDTSSIEIKEELEIIQFPVEFDSNLLKYSTRKGSLEEKNSDVLSKSSKESKISDSSSNLDSLIINEDNLALKLADSSSQAIQSNDSEAKPTELKNDLFLKYMHRANWELKDASRIALSAKNSSNPRAWALHLLCSSYNIWLLTLPTYLKLILNSELNSEIDQNESLEYTKVQIDWIRQVIRSAIRLQFSLKRSLKFAARISEMEMGDSKYSAKSAGGRDSRSNSLSVVNSANYNESVVLKQNKIVTKESGDGGNIESHSLGNWAQFPDEVANRLLLFLLGHYKLAGKSFVDQIIQREPTSNFMISSTHDWSIDDIESMSGQMVEQILYYYVFGSLNDSIFDSSGSGFNEPLPSDRDFSHHNDSPAKTFSKRETSPFKALSLEQLAFNLYMTPDMSNLTHSIRRHSLRSILVHESIKPIKKTLPYCSEAGILVISDRIENELTATIERNNLNSQNLNQYMPKYRPLLSCVSNEKLFKDKKSTDKENVNKTHEFSQIRVSNSCQNFPLDFVDSADQNYMKLPGSCIDIVGNNSSDFGTVNHIPVKFHASNTKAVCPRPSRLMQRSEVNRSYLISGNSDSPILLMKKKAMNLDDSIHDSEECIKTERSASVSLLTKIFPENIFSAASDKFNSLFVNSDASNPTYDNTQRSFSLAGQFDSGNLLASCVSSPVAHKMANSETKNDFDNDKNPNINSLKNCSNTVRQNNPELSNSFKILSPSSWMKNLNSIVKQSPGPDFSTKMPWQKQIERPDSLIKSNQFLNSGSITNARIDLKTTESSESPLFTSTVSIGGFRVNSDFQNIIGGNATGSSSGLWFADTFLPGVMSKIQSGQSDTASESECNEKSELLDLIDEADWLGMNSMADCNSEELENRLVNLWEIISYETRQLILNPPNTAENGNGIDDSQYHSQSEKSDSDPGINKLVATHIMIFSCNTCQRCDYPIHDEEIMDSWSSDSNNLNIKCPSCETNFVAKLTIRLILQTPKVSNPAQLINGQTSKFNYTMLEEYQVIYLSPLVLRKEVENIISMRGSACLESPDFMRKHNIVFWNMIWISNRIGMPCHMERFVLMDWNDIVHNSDQRPEKSASNLLNFLKEWQEFIANKNCPIYVHIRWDSPKIISKSNKPLFQVLRDYQDTNYQRSLQMRNSEMSPPHNPPNLAVKVAERILEHLRQNEMKSAVRDVLHFRGSNHAQSVRLAENLYLFPLYRTIYFLGRVHLGKDRINALTFFKTYANIFHKLPKSVAVQKIDRPMRQSALWCHLIFRDLDI